jgi:phosphoribosylaminoimidazolecarboxamide formyltransferase / IMP cyclohydrolase
VAVLTDASQYAVVVSELKDGGKLSELTRFQLPWPRSTASATTTPPSATTCRRWTERRCAGRRHVPPALPFPGQSNGRFVKLQDLRYGENPHQQAAYYRDLHPRRARWSRGIQLQGKELSTTTLPTPTPPGNASRALTCRPVSSSSTPTPVAWPWADPLEAYRKAFQTDPTSAFGGIIAFNRPLDGEAPGRGKQFVEVLMAPTSPPRRWPCSRPRPMCGC